MKKIVLLGCLLVSVLCLRAQARNAGFEDSLDHKIMHGHKVLTPTSFNLVWLLLENYEDFKKTMHKYNYEPSKFTDSTYVYKPGEGVPYSIKKKWDYLAFLFKPDDGGFAAMVRDWFKRESIEPITLEDGMIEYSFTLNLDGNRNFLVGLYEKNGVLAIQIRELVDQ